MTKHRYTVVFERDEEGWWVATAKGLQGVHTQGRTIQQSRERIREALDAADAPGAATAELVERITVHGVEMATITKARAFRERVEREQAKAMDELRRAAKALTKAGISVRDAGELLGLSHQRVQQLVHNG